MECNSFTIRYTFHFYKNDFITASKFKKRQSLPDFMTQSENEIYFVFSVFYSSITLRTKFGTRRLIREKYYIASQPKFTGSYKKRLHSRHS